ncbi:MAG: ATP-binding protein [Bacteroidales bacterium]|nr:ATP-binding protein [Bacteroidales bacterium]
MIRLSYIQRLIARGESQHLDFKFEIADARKIARSFVSFANTQGGTLLIGVNDDGTIAGIRSEEEYFMAENAAKRFTRPVVAFSSREWNVEKKKKVLEITIPASDMRPHFAQREDGRWMAWIRYGDHDILANSIVVSAWEKKKRIEGTRIVFTELEKILLQYLDKYPDVTLADFRKMTGSSYYQARKIITDLLAVDILDAVIGDDGTSFTLSPAFRAMIMNNQDNK